MLRQYLEHQLQRAINGDIKNAIRSCHVHGLHSIMFHDEPGNRVRMFYADHGHRLGNNLSTKQTLSLALHPHHCDLRFANVFGNAENHRYQVFEHALGDLQEHQYKSAITTHGAGSLTPTGRVFRGVLMLEEKLETNPIMRADALHTIYVPRSEQAAWLVMEGREDPGYQSVCYTNDPNPDLTGLYIGMPQPMVVDIIQDCLYRLDHG